MNPHYVTGEHLVGTLDVKDAGTIYYELRGRSDQPKVVLIMGAFSTLRHYDEVADFLSSNGFCVLTYDHRGIGRSTALRTDEAQTSKMLASDCVALSDEVFGDTASIHIYGASMGGFVAQHVALMLQTSKRLKSLYLAVTSRGPYFTMPLPQSVWKFLVKNLIIKSDPHAMVMYLVPKCFDKEFRETVDEKTGRTMGQLWEDKWTREYRDWFSFADLDATASQCAVTGTHYLSADDLKPLVGCNVTVHVASQDELMSPAKQQELADILKAKVARFDGGHLLGRAQKTKFFETLLGHLRSAP
jgi:pimeloyl-ACP methyl ester carboxylesterase